jgi:hypothetical protein
MFLKLLHCHYMYVCVCIYIYIYISMFSDDVQIKWLNLIELKPIKVVSMACLAWTVLKAECIL